jgi:hypothetical protein
VFDTLGKLVDRIGDYLIVENPKNGNGKGSLSMPGWGALKVEFHKLLKLAQSKNKHLIFVAHEREERDGEIRIVRPDVSGSSGKDLVKDLDFLGYMEMRGNKRTISFSPCEKYYAKNSLRLPPVIDVPDTAEKGNTFIRDVIIRATLERLNQDAAEARRYEELLAELAAQIDAAASPVELDEALRSVQGAEAIWDSQRVAKHRLQDRARALNISYDRAAGRFVAAAAAAE